MLGRLREPISHADWSMKLLQVEYALNTSVHSTTIQTPSEIMFGVRQRGDTIYELTEYIVGKGSEDRDLEKIRLNASEAILRSQICAADRAKARNRPARKYEVGEYVCKF